jgi:hypothetical protein
MHKPVLEGAWRHNKSACFSTIEKQSTRGRPSKTKGALEAVERITKSVKSKNATGHHLLRNNMSTFFRFLCKCHKGAPLLRRQKRIHTP